MIMLTVSLITGSGFDDCRPGANQTLLLGVQDHAVANSVFHGTTRIQEFTFGI